MENLVSFNVSSLSSHAFIVTKTAIQALELPSLTIDLVQQHTAIWTTKSSSVQIRLQPVSDPEDEIENEDEAVLARRESLKWLWGAALRLVLAASNLLSKPDGDTRHRPRIWWIGGGLMALAPLHAAGYHPDNSKENTTSYVTSSYPLISLPGGLFVMRVRKSGRNMVPKTGCSLFCLVPRALG